MGTPSGHPLRTLALLAAALALGVGAVLYAVMAPATPDAPDKPGASTSADPAPAAASAKASGPATKTAAPDSDAAHVHGVVRFYRSKAAVEGLAVTLKSKDYGERTATTGKDGVFRFDDVSPASGWELRAVRDPYAPIALTLDLAAKEDRDVDVLWLEVPVALTAYVIDLSGKPLKGAQVDVFAVARAGDISTDQNWWWDRRSWEQRVLAVTSNPKPTKSAVCDAEGKAVVSGLTPGTFRVRASAAGYATQTRGGVMLAPDAAPSPVRLVLGPGHKLEGTLTDEKGKPVSEANVIAALGESWSVGFDRWSATTTAKGAYVLDGLADGKMQLYVERKGKPLLLVGGVGIPETPRFDIRLRPGATISGSTVDEDGKPVVGAEVRMAMQNSWSPMAATTDKEGKFELVDVPAGPIAYFRIDAKGYMPYPDPSAPAAGSGESLREGAVMTRDVVLRRGLAAEIHVVGADTAAAIEGCEVTLYVVKQWGDTSQPWKETTDKEGLAKFGGLVPGNYLVALRAAGYVQEDLPPNFTSLLRSPDAMPAQWRLDVTGGDGAPAKGEYKLTRGASVSGTVWDANKQPVSGAQVTVSGARNEFPVFSDPEGKFKVDAVAPSNRCTAGATGPGGVRGTSDPFIVRPGQAVENIDVKLGASGRVTGSARTPDGKPLVGAMVRFVAGKLDDGNTWAFQQFQSAERWPISADGRFEIPAIPEGNVTVRADAEGYLPAWKNDVVVRGNQETGGVELILKNAVEISGRVEAQTGGPVSGAQVSAQFEGGNRRYGGGRGFVTGLSGEPSAQTDAEGKFTLKGLQEGGYTISAQAPGYAAGTRVTTKTGAGDVLIRLATGMKISGVVKDESSGPVGGVPVRAAKIQTDQNEWWWWGDAQVYTAPDGSFTLTDVADGAYDLTVSAMWQWGREVNVEDTKLQGVNAGRDDVVITVKTGSVIEGSIVDHDGKPVRVAWITAQFESADQRNNDWSSQRWAQAKPDGTFRVVGLKPGSYTLYAYGDFKYTTLKGVASGTKDAKIQVEPGYSISGRMVDSDGLSIAGGWANFQIRKAGENDWQWTNVVQPGDGGFVLLGLEQGGYDVQIQANGYAPAMSANVAAGSRDVVVVLQKGLEMSGVVLDGSSNPIAGANVQAVQLNAQTGVQPSQGSAQTDAQGAFKLAGLAAGNYRLVVRSTNFAPAVVPFASAGSTTVKVVLEGGTTLSGTVADESGTVPSGVQMNLQIYSDDGLWLNTNVRADGGFEFQHVTSNKKWRVNGWAWGPNAQYQLSADGQVESGATDVKVVAKLNR